MHDRAQISEGNLPIERISRIGSGDRGYSGTDSAAVLFGRVQQCV